MNKKFSYFTQALTFLILSQTGLTSLEAQPSITEEIDAARKIVQEKRLAVQHLKISCFADVINKPKRLATQEELDKASGTEKSELKEKNQKLSTKILPIFATDTHGLPLSFATLKFINKTLKYGFDDARQLEGLQVEVDLAQSDLEAKYIEQLEENGETTGASVLSDLYSLFYFMKYRINDQMSLNYSTDILTQLSSQYSRSSSKKGHKFTFNDIQILMNDARKNTTYQISQSERDIIQRITESGRFPSLVNAEFLTKESPSLDDAESFINDNSKDESSSNATTLKGAINFLSKKYNIDIIDDNQELQTDESAIK